MQHIGLARVVHALADHTHIHERWFGQFALGVLQGTICGGDFGINFGHPLPQRLNQD